MTDKFRKETMHKNDIFFNADVLIDGLWSKTI